MIAGSFNGQPFKYIGPCDIVGFPHVVQGFSKAGLPFVTCVSPEGRTRCGLFATHFVNKSEIEFDV